MCTRTAIRGAAGYTTADLAVTAGEVLTVIVGAGAPTAPRDRPARTTGGRRELRDQRVHLWRPGRRSFRGAGRRRRCVDRGRRRGWRHGVSGGGWQPGRWRGGGAAASTAPTRRSPRPPVWAALRRRAAPGARAPTQARRAPSIWAAIPCRTPMAHPAAAGGTGRRGGLRRRQRYRRRGRRVGLCGRGRRVQRDHGARAGAVQANATDAADGGAGAGGATTVNGHPGTVTFTTYTGPAPTVTFGGWPPPPWRS